VSEEFELPEDYMAGPPGSRVIYIQKEGSNQLNAIVLGCAATLCLAILGIGAWGISALITTREELAGVRAELRGMNDRLSRLEQRP
jgi:hypothetical protein